MSSDGSKSDWQIVANTLAERLVDGSLLHTFTANKKIKKQTKALNERLKKLYRVKSYSQYVHIRKSVKEEFPEDDETDDEPGLAIQDYRRIYQNKELLLSKDATDEFPKIRRNANSRKNNKLDSESNFFVKTKKNTSKFDNTSEGSCNDNSSEANEIDSESDFSLRKKNKKKKNKKKKNEKHYSRTENESTNRERQKLAKLYDIDDIFDTTSSLEDTILDTDSSADCQHSQEDAHSVTDDARNISRKQKVTKKLESLKEGILDDENRVKCNKLTKSESIDSPCNREFRTEVKLIHNNPEDEDFKLILSSGSDESDGCDEIVKPKLLKSSNDRKKDELKTAGNCRKVKGQKLEFCKEIHRSAKRSYDDVEASKIKHKRTKSSKQLLLSDMAIFSNPKKRFNPGITEDSSSKTIERSDETVLSGSYTDTGNSKNSNKHKTSSAHSEMDREPENSKLRNKSEESCSSAKNKLKTLESSDNHSQEAIISQVIQKRPIDIKRNLSAAMENFVSVKDIQKNSQLGDESTVRSTQSTDGDIPFGEEDTLQEGIKEHEEDNIPVWDREDVEGLRIIENDHPDGDQVRKSKATKLSLNEIQRFDNNSDKGQDNSTQRTYRHDSSSVGNVTEQKLVLENPIESLQPSETCFHPETQIHSEVQKEKALQWITKSEIISTKYKIINDKLHTIPQFDETVIAMEQSSSSTKPPQSKKSDNLRDDDKTTAELEHARSLEQVKMCGFTKEHNVSSDDLDNTIKPRKKAWKTDNLLLQTTKSPELDVSKVKNWSDGQSNDEVSSELKSSPTKLQKTEGNTDDRDPIVLKNIHEHQQRKNRMDNSYCDEDPLAEKRNIKLASTDKYYDDFKNLEQLTKKKKNLSLQNINHLSKDNLCHDKKLALKRKDTMDDSANDTEVMSTSLEMRKSKCYLDCNESSKRTKLMSSHRKSSMSDSSSEHSKGKENRSKSSTSSKIRTPFKNSGTNLRESDDEITKTTQENTSEDHIGDTLPDKVVITPRPQNLQDLIHQEALTLDSTDVTFGLEDISDSEDIWIVDIPRTVNPMHLEGQQISFGGKRKFRIGKECYKAFSRKNDSSLSCILNTGRPKKPYKVVNIKSVGAITIRRKLSSVACAEMMNPEKSRVPFPKNLKARHPLLGTDYQNKIAVNDGNKAGVSLAEDSSKKAEKSRKEYSGWNDTKRMVKAEDLSTEKKISSKYREVSSESEELQSMTLSDSCKEEMKYSEDHEKTDRVFWHSNISVNAELPRKTKKK